MSALHFGDVSKPIGVVMLHANGFNGQSYRHLLEALPIHSVALDLRGHGLTKLPCDRDQLRNFHIFRDDVLAFIEQAVEGPFVLSGHSLGACAALLCVPHLQGKMVAYVGFDPPLMPTWLTPLFRLPGGLNWLRKTLPIAAAAARRRHQFDSQDAALKRYKNRGVFKGFPDATLTDYLEGGLIEDEETGGVKLACDPLWEQAIYPAHDHNLYQAAKALPVDNARIVLAGEGAPHTPLSRLRMRRAVGNGGVIRFKDKNHMFPLNEPEFARAFLQDALKKGGLIQD